MAIITYNPTIKYLSENVLKIFKYPSLLLKLEVVRSLVSIDLYQGTTISWLFPGTLQDWHIEHIKNEKTMKFIYGDSW